MELIAACWSCRKGERERERWGDVEARRVGQRAMGEGVAAAAGIGQGEADKIRAYAPEGSRGQVAISGSQKGDNAGLKNWNGREMGKGNDEIRSLGGSGGTWAGWAGWAGRGDAMGGQVGGGVQGTYRQTGRIHWKKQFTRDDEGQK